MNKHLSLILLGFGLVSCATVTYNSTVLQPGSSANINEYIYEIGDQNLEEVLIKKLKKKKMNTLALDHLRSF